MHMYQIGLFDEFCRECNKFLSEYDGMCDGCASDYEYNWYLFLTECGFWDYSEAVKLKGCEFINNAFENWLKKSTNQ